jgi:hypothetical protein
VSGLQAEQPVEHALQTEPERMELVGQVETQTSTKRRKEAEQVVQVVESVQTSQLEPQSLQVRSESEPYFPVPQVGVHAVPKR